jgi:DNA polymerase elongation subunit (family B)
MYQYYPTKIKTKEDGIIHIHSVENVPIPDETFDKFGGRQEYYDEFYDTINKTLKGYSSSPEIIYGDTDSVFFNCHIVDNVTGEKLKNKEALKKAIIIGVWASHCACLLLMSPQALAYEKTLWPFAILTKKRYVGNLYEEDPDVFEQKSMGIVLKRRDNALIVKLVCGGVIDQMLNKQSATGAVEFVKKMLVKILSGEYPIDKFIVTKTLRETYVNRTSIVHAVLADKMCARDPGNKPMPNDRIPYAYVELDYEPELQGERVEHPNFINENNLKLDYLFYITNQIMKPVVQFLDLIVDNPEQIFNNYIVREKNRRKKIKPIHHYINNNNEHHYVSDNNDNNDNNDIMDNVDTDDEDFDVQVIAKPKKKSKKKSKIIDDISDDESFIN